MNSGVASPGHTQVVLLVGECVVHCDAYVQFDVLKILPEVLQVIGVPLSLRSAAATGSCGSDVTGRRLVREQPNRVNDLVAILKETGSAFG